MMRSNASWVMVTWHHPPPSRQPDTTENITFATPLVGGNKVAGEL